MPVKGDRPTAEHIMKILESCKGKAMRFSDIKRAMLAQGYFHTDKAILDNFKVLIDEGKIVKAERHYGIPVLRDDGTTYITVESFNCTRVIELGK